jgi:hypothetical protein
MRGVSEAEIRDQKSKIKKTDDKNQNPGTLLRIVSVSNETAVSSQQSEFKLP